MLSHLFDAQRARLALIWLCVMVPVTWSEPSLPPPAGPAKPKRPRSAEPQPFAGLTHKPHGALWDPETGAPAPAPPPRPAPRPPPAPPFLGEGFESGHDVHIVTLMHVPVVLAACDLTQPGAAPVPAGRGSPPPALRARVRG